LFDGAFNEYYDLVKQSIGAVKANEGVCDEAQWPSFGPTEAPDVDRDRESEVCPSTGGENR
jgi:hypothetical protein